MEVRRDRDGRESGKGKGKWGGGRWRNWEGLDWGVGRDRLRSGEGKWGRNGRRNYEGEEWGGGGKVRK